MRSLSGGALARPLLPDLASFSSSQRNPPTIRPMAQQGTGQGGFSGAIKLFRFAGIQVYLHWSWAVVGLIEIQSRSQHYSSRLWNAIEYVSLFAIVLMHEFGHALACRSVGGRSERILLWPFGGIAFVDPPRRPGAVLWSIAAGPLVNVALIPVTLGLSWGVSSFMPSASNDLKEYLSMLAFINIGLLVFNMLPIYPLDGGQILQSILWYFIGFARSLAAASILGMIGAVGVIILSAVLGDFWLIMLAILGISQSWKGLTSARMLSKVLALPRHAHAKCPSCHEAPPIGAATQCTCGQPFDIFANAGVCPRCGEPRATAWCVYCNVSSSYAAWCMPELAEARVVSFKPVGS